MANKTPDEAPVTSHDVYIDGAGFGGRHIRYTCQNCSPGDVSTTCLRHPYMNDAEWEAALAKFKKEHPFTEPMRYPGE